MPPPRTSCPGFFRTSEGFHYHSGSTSHQPSMPPCSTPDFFRASVGSEASMPPPRTSCPGFFRTSEGFHYHSGSTIPSEVTVATDTAAGPSSFISMDHPSDGGALPGSRHQGKIIMRESSSACCTATPFFRASFSNSNLASSRMSECGTSSTSSAGRAAFDRSSVCGANASGDIAGGTVRLAAMSGCGMSESFASRDPPLQCVLRPEGLGASRMPFMRLSDQSFRATAAPVKAVEDISFDNNQNEGCPEPPRGSEELSSLDIDELLAMLPKI